MELSTKASTASITWQSEKRVPKPRFWKPMEADTLRFRCEGPCTVQFSNAMK